MHSLIRITPWEHFGQPRMHSFYKQWRHNYGLQEKDPYTFYVKINPCPAEKIKMPRPLLIFSRSDYLIHIVAINSHTKRQTVQSQLIWIYTVCKCRIYPGSAGQGLKLRTNINLHILAVSSWPSILMYAAVSSECTACPCHIVGKGSQKKGSFRTYMNPDQPPHLYTDQDPSSLENWQVVPQLL